MLPRSQRLSVEQFNNVIKNGRVFHSPLFYLRILSITGLSKISATVPTKVAKTAVGRNRLRRVIYEAVQPLVSTLIPNIQIIIFAKNTALKANFVEIKKDIESIFVKKKLLK